MSEKETIEKIKARQNLISKIQDVLLFGKGTIEDLKEFDRQLREDYHKEMSNLRHRWEEIYLEILESQQPSLNRKSKTVIQRLDRVMEQVNRASYGYAPLFNRLGQIKANELARVFNYDKDFNKYLSRIKEIEDNVAKCIERNDLKAVSEGINNMIVMLENAERRWKDREKSFRSSEI